MSNTIKATEQVHDYKIMPSGSKIARVIRVIDLGTQSMPKYNAPPGTMTDRERIMLIFEVPEETIIIKDTDGTEKELPMVISKEYTKSMYETASLRLDLEAWAAKKFSDDQLEAFDVNTICGKACMINVKHSTSKDGKKTYANVEGISGLPKGVTCPPAVNAVFTYELEEGVGGHFQELPEWIQKKILSAKEWSVGKQPINGGIGSYDVPDEPHVPSDEELDAIPNPDLPF